MASFSIASSSAWSNSSPGSADAAARRTRAPARPRRGSTRVEVEDRPLPDLRVELHLLAGCLGLLEDQEHALARRARRPERAALDERLDRPLVDGARVDARAEVPYRRERPTFVARGLDRLDRRVADALHRIEAEADVAVDDDELVVGQVDVGRQDLDAHALGLGAKNGHLVLGVHHRGDQRRHVLGGVVGLQPRGAVGDQRVTRRVGLVEGVVGRALVGVPQPVDDLLGHAVAPAALDELGLERGHRLAVLLADRLAQVVRLGPGEPGQGLGDLHRLLLVEDHAVRGAEDRLQALVGTADGVGVALAAGVGRDLVHRARPVQRVERDEVVELGRLDLAQRALHALGLELEHADRVAAGHHLVGLGIVERQAGHVRPHAGRALDDVQRVLDDVEVAQAQEVHLQQAELLDRLHRELRDELVVLLAVAVAVPVAVEPPESASCSGTTSVSGMPAMTTAAAWIEALRTIPSRPRATSTICLAVASVS